MNIFGTATDRTIFAEHALIDGDWCKHTLVTIADSKIASIDLTVAGTAPLARRKKKHNKKRKHVTYRDRIIGLLYELYS